MYIHKELISILCLILSIGGIIVYKFFRDFQRLNAELKKWKKKPLSARDYFFFHQFEPVVFNLNSHLKNYNSSIKKNKRQILFYEKFFDLFPDPLFIVDEINQIVELNLSATKLVGRDAKTKNINSVLRIPNLGDLIMKSNFEKKPQISTLKLVYPVETIYTVWVSGSSKFIKNKLNFIRLYDCTSEKKVQELQTEFVANVSHELKTPVSAMVGYCETLLGIGKKDNKVRTKFLKILKKESLRMSSLVSDLLSLTRIERIEHTKPEGIVNLNKLLNEIQDSYSSSFKDKKILKLIMSSKEIETIGDYNELKQVFINIIDNAIKYSDSKSPIELKVKPNQELINISIKDFGKGINESDIPMLTNRFYRVDSTRSRDLGSTGLGLSIVKHILNRHQSELSIKSKINEGSEFSFNLPIK